MLCCCVATSLARELSVLKRNGVERAGVDVAETLLPGSSSFPANTNVDLRA